MAILDVIEYFDETGEEIVHRIPEHGSAETRYGSQLVVRENQAAVFFRDGKGLDVLGPGRHTLSTQNIPVLTGILKRVAGFGESSPFRVETLFINMKVFTNMRWGTREPVAFRDKDLGIVRLRAFGNFTMRVKDPLLFVNNLVGTMGSFSTESIDGYLKDVIVSRLNDLLGEQLESIFDLPALYDEFGVAVKMRLTEDFAKYGLELIDFFVQSVTPPEEVQKMIDERSGMGAVGDLNQFMHFQAAKSMRDAASGEGGGGAAGIGMGAGVGAGFGMMMPGMMGQSIQQSGQEQGTGGGGAAQQAPGVQCPGCGHMGPQGAKFCMNCGQKMPAPGACPNCGAATSPGAKFCGQCGNGLSAKPKCPKCGEEVEPGSKFCGSCGENLSE